MKKIFLLLVVIFSLTNENISAQTLSLQTIGNFLPYVNESSGIEQTDTTSIWTHSDSGGRPVLYHYLLNGQLIDSTIIKGIANTDWEDLTNDQNGVMFIGDFGNNFSNRTDLKIYRVFTYALASGTDTVFADTISFSYPDQTAFPPSNGNLNFDCEAFIHADDSLYLFTKNISTTNSSGYTKCYRLPTIPGNYVAELVDSFYSNEQITSADYSMEDSMFVLLTYQSVFVFNNIEQHHFFSTVPEQFNFSSITQKEGILIKNNHQFYISDEKIFGIGGNLYLTDIISGVDKTNCSKSNFRINPNPSKAQFSITTEEFVNENLCITIFNSSGTEVWNGKNLKVPVDISGDYFYKGIYFIQIENENGEIVVCKAVLY